MTRRSVVAFALLAVALPAVAQEKIPAGRTVVKLEARPAAVALKHAFDYSQVLLAATLDNGDVQDVTRLATLAVPAAVKVSPAGLVRPVGDGAGVITAPGRPACSRTA